MRKARIIMMARTESRVACFQRLDLVFRAALAAGDHAPAWPMVRPGGAVRPAMKPDGRFPTALFLFIGQELRGIFFGRAADLTDHDDGGGFIVAKEHLQHVDELGALHRVAANADGCRLAKPSLVVWNTAS
jgi:hypothetical protein